MSTPTPTRITVTHRPDGSMTLTVTDLLNGTEMMTVLDEAERRSLLRGIISGARDVRGYVVLVPNRSEAFEVGATGVVFADAGQANAEATWAEDEFGLTGSHVGMVLAVLGGPDDQMPVRSDPEAPTT